MDPYYILGISNNATQEEVKIAYRREAMKWHPDRCNNSAEAKDRFHRAAEAYKILSEKNAKGGDGGFSAGSSGAQQHRKSSSDQSNNHSNSRYARGDSGDPFADSVFWDVMLDYAIKLAQTGLSEKEIAFNVAGNGCSRRLAAVIADKAFNIHAHYASGSANKRKHGADQSTFKQERLEAELLRAFIGERNLFWSPGNTVQYYLVVFSEFRQGARSNPLSWIYANNRLMRILNFSILLFAVITLAINYYPEPSKYKLLPDIALLQLPLAVLPLMFIWTIYRRLWIFTLILGFSYLATIAIFNSFMPQALNSDLISILQIAAICFAPFVFIALFANFFYYRKALNMIRSANHLFEEHLDKIVWIKNRSGPSSTAAFLFGLIFYSSLIYVVPWHEEFLNSFGFQLPDIDIVKDDTATLKTKLRLQEAGQYFEIAESHFNNSPADNMQAEIAYGIAADNGSLLAAYKLGYMYYVGEGVRQNDVLALEYFERAIRAPLAFQPHSLQLTTVFLAESYNNLGIMYQSGYGTRMDLKKAYEMYSRGSKFGSENAKLNLKTVYKSGASTERRSLTIPIYK